MSAATSFSSRCDSAACCLSETSVDGPSAGWRRCQWPRTGFQRPDAEQPIIIRRLLIRAGMPSHS